MVLSHRFSSDAIVIGGGLVGCLSARALAAGGRSVLLLEAADALGGESSSAAAGLLSPQMEAVEEILVRGDESALARSDAMLALCLAARAGYRGEAEELERATGRAVHYRADGTLVVALEPSEAEVLARRAAGQRERGLRAEWLEAREARALEPAIAPAAVGAVHLPDDHQVDNVALVAAAAAAVRADPRIAVRSGARVEGLAVEGSALRGARIEGETVAAEIVVLAAGAWSSALAGVPRRITVRPVKGQMAAVRPERPLFRKIVGGRGVYCVPRDDGRVLIGATVEEAGFDKTVDPAAVEGLVAAAVRVVPDLGSAPVVSRWAGLRPGTADDLPLIGADPEVEGLIWATGHYRNGILLAPLTARIVAAVVDGAPAPVDVDAFAPGRRPPLSE